MSVTCPACGGQLLGDSQAQALRIVVAGHAAGTTSYELSVVMHLSRARCSNVLRELFGRGYVTRESYPSSMHGGKEFVYRATDLGRRVADDPDLPVQMPDDVIDRATAALIRGIPSEAASILHSYRRIRDET